jgi:hypothetical protein
MQGWFFLVVVGSAIWLVRRARAIATHPQFAAATHSRVGSPPMPAGGYGYGPGSPMTGPVPGFPPPPAPPPYG